MLIVKGERIWWILFSSAGFEQKNIIEGIIATIDLRTLKVTVFYANYLQVRELEGDDNGRMRDYLVQPFQENGIILKRMSILKRKKIAT